MWIRGFGKTDFGSQWKHCLFLIPRFTSSPVRYKLRGPESSTSSAAEALYLVWRGLQILNGNVHDSDTVLLPNLFTLVTFIGMLAVPYWTEVNFVHGCLKSRFIWWYLSVWVEVRGERCDLKNVSFVFSTVWKFIIFLYLDSFSAFCSAELIPSFCNSSTRSPFWCIWSRMSHPPTNSPLKYTWGIVGQLEKSLTPVEGRWRWCQSQT